MQQGQNSFTSDHFRAIIEATSDAIVTVGEDGRIVSWNGAAERMFGYTAAEARQQPVELVLPDGVHARHRQAFGGSRYADTGRVDLNMADQPYCQRRGGARFPVDVTISAWCHGGRHFFTAIIRDCTDRVAVEDGFRHARQYLEYVFEAIGDGILITNQDGVITAVNGSLLKLLGYQEDELLGMHIAALGADAADGGGELPAVVQQLRETGRVQAYESEWRRKNGSSLIVALNITALCTDAGDVGAVATVRDITERTIAQQTLERTKAYLDNVIDRSLDCIVISDQKGRIIRANQAFRDLVGFGDTGVVGRGMGDFLPPGTGRYPCTTGENVLIDDAYYRDVMTHTEQLYADGRLSNWESYFIRADGVLVPIDQNIVILHDHNGAVSGAVGVTRDITARRKAERSMKRFSSRLMEVREQEKQRLSMDLHDELGTMAVEVGTRITLAREELKQGSAESVARALDELQEAVRSGVGRIRAIAVELRPPELDIIGLSTVLAAYCDGVIANAGVRVTLDMAVPDSDLSPETATALYRISQEALTNVVRHAAADRADLALSREGDLAVMTITDPGCGFECDGSALMRDGCLGLQGMRERVDALGGGFVVKSTPGNGTRIRVEVPLTGMSEEEQG